MYTLFLQFLTDYSGIDSAVGKVGFAAGFGTVILLITRIIDGIDDPIQAYLIDGAKETRFGKYRKFTIIGIIAIALGIIGLFAIPRFIKSNAVLLTTALFIYKKLYPIDQKKREEITSILAERRAQYDTNT